MGLVSSLVASMLAAAPGESPPAELSAEAVGETRSGVDAYCRYVSSAADSEAALLQMPKLFAQLGMLNPEMLSGDVVIESPNAPPAIRPRLRLITGLSYSLGNLYQGHLARERAAAACATYQAGADLWSFLRAYQDGATRTALAAKAAVLDAALPGAQEMVQSLRGQVESGRATVEELNATELRVDAIRSLAIQTRQEMETVPPVQPPRSAIADLLRARDAAEEDEERVAARARQSQAWDVLVKGGYDQVFGLDNRLPVFGTVLLSFDLGRLWQGDADERARGARRDWVGLHSEGVDQLVEQLLRKMRAMKRAEERRLRESSVLLADLETRLKAVAALKLDKVKQYRDFLWLELVKVRAENEYLKAHVADLALILGEADRD